jgi:hypothetical protein
MYKYILESVDQINWLAIIPLLIFFVFFTAIVYRAWKTDKNHISKMKQLPLQD